MKDLYTVAKKLYEAGFPGEDPAFTDALFALGFPQHLEGIAERGTLLSMLFALPYPVITAQGELLINSTSPMEQVFYPTLPLEGESVEYPYIMRKGGYFVLDDYRTCGEDSRSFGQLLEEELLGKVVYVFRRRGI